ncbi:LysR family transcriptional regulator [Pendulispora brunnea]|uniref:LysR family transcriptional regulator n=1 Tax=Pendulispora brunnea TaxID=2905690 RepID=A0ABZ2K9T3_9BACT
MTILRDPLAGLSAFVRSVEAGSFSAAARMLGATPSAVSKAVARLEAEVGVRLLHRTTRAVHLTPEGQALYERGSRIVLEACDVRKELSEATGVRGPLRVTAPVDLGQPWLAPRIVEFLERFPDVRVELSLTNRFVDLVEERFDVGLRLGPVRDPRLVRRKLGPTGAIVCASPAYLRKRGTPRRLDDLAHHATLAYTRNGKSTPWRFVDRDVDVQPGPFGSDDNVALLTAALAGLGIARLPTYVAAPEIERGRLRVLFPDRLMQGPTASVIYPEQRYPLARLRAFIDFISTAFIKTPP